jgi:hypothetical protein
MEGTTSPFKLSFAPFIAGLGSGGTPAISWVSRWAYYDGSASAPLMEKTYAAASDTPTPLKPTGAAFASAGSVQESLETCVLLQAQVGVNSKNKPNFCRKYIHGVPSGNVVYGTDSVDVQWNFEPAAATAAAAMGNGSWYLNRVYCSPSGGQAIGAGWVAEPYPGNHQMPRGRKRKKTSVTSVSTPTFDILLGAAADAIEDLL